jgi:hypothetical protein
MPGRETKKPIKKTVVKKTVAKKTVTKQSKVTLDNFPFDELLKICKKDKGIADKMQQLISDYSFEKDQTERERCICIAFGNWAMSNYDANNDGTVDEFELDSNKRADKILKAMNKVINK